MNLDLFNSYNIQNKAEVSNPVNINNFFNIDYYQGYLNYYVDNKAEIKIYYKKISKAY